MLVLSRFLGESIVVGEGPTLAVITVVDIRGDKVRLGISAPVDVPVDREEIRRRKERTPLRGEGVA